MAGTCDSSDHPGDSSWPSTSSSSISSEDDFHFNSRVSPVWQSYNNLFKRLGFRLDTVRDVKEYCRKRGSGQHLHLDILRSSFLNRSQGQANGYDDDALCPDYGLPDNLFRGTRIGDGKKVVIKAVHLGSNEYDVIRLLSSAPLRDDPMNHTIRLSVLSFIEVPKDDIVFIVMEQWSSHFVPDACCLKMFLAAMRQCVEHIVFTHRNNVAHLDISMRNIVTDFEGHYAYIDYEQSQRFDGVELPTLYCDRGTEIPPELERDGYSNPYKVDIWALGITILRACKTAGYGVNIPELLQIVNLMIHELPEQRPTSSSILNTFDEMVASTPEHRLQTPMIDECGH